MDLPSAPVHDLKAALAWSRILGADATDLKAELRCRWLDCRDASAYMPEPPPQPKTLDEAMGIRRASFSYPRRPCRQK
jgi:hypothetical protein